MSIEGLVTEFEEYGKTPRLYRDVVITEKINGTNAAIKIARVAQYGWATYHQRDNKKVTATMPIDDTWQYVVVAQSRNRVITPEDDNFGFAAWVKANASALIKTLGEGTHFGEWYGAGIQGNPYHLPDKNLALFNTHRWGSVDFDAAGLPNVDAVPVIATGVLSDQLVNSAVNHLKAFGSIVGARRGLKAEGVVVYHTASREVFKVLLENDDVPKSVANAA